MSESSTLRVEIADAGGTQVELPHRVADELRALAVDAVVVPLEAIVQTSADAVILRGDAPGVLGILRSLRDDGARPGTPVLLLGTPEGTGPFKEGPGFGAEHVLAKDASASRIAEVLARITGRKSASADPSRERKVEHTLELSQRGEAGAGDWQVRSGFLATPEERFGEADRQSLLPSEPPGVSRLGNEAHERPDEVSQVLASAGLSAVFESSHGDVDSPHRRTGSSPGDRRSDSVAPGTGSHPGTGVSSPGSVPSTSQFFVVASISDELRKILYDADRRVFADRPLVDVSLPRGEDAARDLVPDEFVEVLSLALDEAERADVELTFVGATAARADAPPRARPTPDPEPASDADEVEQQRPKTSPGTPSSISRRPPEPETRLSPDPQIAPPRPYVSEAPRASEGPAAREDALVRPSQPPSRVALASSERGDLAPLGAFALLGQLALGRLDVVLTLRVQDKPVVLSLARGELAQASGEGFVELRRRALHRLLSASLGAGQATDASRGDASFALERASRLAEEAVLAEVLLEARGAFSIEPRVVDARVDGSRLTQRTLASTVLEVSRRALSADRVAAHFLPDPDDPTVSRLERLSRLEVARVPNLERVLDAIEAPRELAWLLRRTTATQPTNLASLVAAAPDEPGLVAAVFVVAQLGGLAIGVLSEATSLAHTDLDARAEKSIAALRERADRADYFEVLGIPRDSDGPAVVDAHYRLRAELLAWPLADLGLARLEADRMRILSVLDDAADVLSEARARRRYARGLDVG